MKNNNMEFKYFDTTADIGIEVCSNDIRTAYINSAKATLNLITDIEKIEPKISKEVYIESEDEYGLLYDWITELIILLDSENFMSCNYDIQLINNNNKKIIKGILSGDIYDTDIYNYKTEVKAITYHQMSIEKEDDEYIIRFIVDL